MTRRSVSGLIVCWTATIAAGQPAWKDVSDPPPAKTVAAIEDKVADLVVPDSFFAPEVTFADQFGPFVAVGRNGAPQEGRVVYDLRTGKQVAELKGKLPIDKPVALSPDGTL